MPGRDMHPPAFAQRASHQATSAPSASRRNPAGLTLRWVPLRPEHRPRPLPIRPAGCRYAPRTARSRCWSARAYTQVLAIDACPSAAWVTSRSPVFA